MNRHTRTLIAGIAHALIAAGNKLFDQLPMACPNTPDCVICMLCNECEAHGKRCIDVPVKRKFDDNDQ